MSISKSIDTVWVGTHGTTGVLGLVLSEVDV